MKAPKRSASAERLVPFIPRPPVGRLNIQPFPCHGIHPTIEDVAARKDERMFTVRVDNGEFQVPVEWRCRGSLPHPRNLPVYAPKHFDSNHGPWKKFGPTLRHEFLFADALSRSMVAVTTVTRCRP